MVGRGVRFIVAAATIVGAAVVAAEPKTAADEKPDLELPEVVIEGVDQSLLGVGDMPTVGDPRTGALPLPDPPLADPRDIVVDDGASRSTFDPLPSSRPPAPLTVRGFLEGGSYRTLRAGFDAMRQLDSGGVFGNLNGVASGGHLDDGGWTRASARVGGVWDVPAGGVARGQLRYRAREQDLPVSGRITDDLGAPDRTQTYRRWGVDARYLYDERDDVQAELSTTLSRASFRRATGASSQSFLDGTVRAHADVPLNGRLWNIGASVAVGGRSEESADGGDVDRTRVDVRVVGRVGDEDGFGLEAGLGYLRFGGADVAGPEVTVFYQMPPTRRVWVGMEPFLREPDLLGFYERVPFAGDRVGQAAETADFRLHGGMEWKPSPLATFEAGAGLRRSTGLAHADVDPDRPGLYDLANLDERYVFDVTGAGEVELVPGVSAIAAYRAELIEGTKVPYVSEHTGSLGVRYRGRFDAGTEIAYAGPMWGSAAEGSPRLDAAWLWSATGGVELVPRTWLTVSLENLLDDEHLELAEYASSGRRIEAGFRYAF